MLETKKPIKYSPSSLKDADCLKKLWYRWFSGVKARQEPRIDFGVRMHTLVEYILRTGVEPNKVTEEELWLLEHVFKALKDYIPLVMRVEEWQSLTEPFLTTAKPDLILSDGWVVDFKFPEAPWNGTRWLDYEDQAFWYMWHTAELEKDWPLAGTIFVVTSRRPVRTEFFRVGWNARRFQELMNKWKGDVARIEQASTMGNWPAKPSKRGCAWCLFNHVCTDKV